MSKTIVSSALILEAKSYDHLSYRIWYMYVVEIITYSIIMYFFVVVLCLFVLVHTGLEYRS